MKGCFASLLGMIVMTAALTSARGSHASPLERSALSVLDLTWDAPAGCPSAIDVEQAVRRLVGEGHGAKRPLQVHGRVREDSGAFHVVLEVAEGDTRPERDVVAPTCELATQAAVVVIAMLIPEDVAPEPSVSSPPPPPPPSPPGPPRALWFSVGAFAESGALPTIAPGLAASAAWHSSQRYAVRLDLGATATSHTTVRTTIDGRALGGDFRLWVLGLRGELPLASTPVSITAGFEAGNLHAGATGALDPATRDAAWFALCAGAIGHWRVGERVALVTSLELVVPVARPSFRIDTDFVHRPAAAGDGR